MNIFHLAFKVKDIESTRKFYIDLLGCEEGRSTTSWIDFNFFGHQLSAHVSADMPELDYCGLVDEVRVPIPHFGCLLTTEQFEAIQKVFETEDIEFIVKPQTRYLNQTGEQNTMLVCDYSGNPIEFKSYSSNEEIYSN